MARTVETTQTEIDIVEDDIEDNISAMRSLVHRIDELLAKKKVADARKEMVQELKDLKEKAAHCYFKYGKLRANFEEMKNKFEDRE